MKEKTACFTGHRPEKLPYGGQPDHPFTQMLKSLIFYNIYNSAEFGYEYFISGMARGIDLWAAEFVLTIKENYFPNLKLICALPHPDHGKNYKGEDRYKFCTIMEQADEIVCVSPRYTKGCYHARNRYMVDRSSKIIGALCEPKSGTGYTIEYAKQKRLMISIADITDFIYTTFKPIEDIVYLD